MTREEKSQYIDGLTEKLNNANIFYLADIAGLNAETTSKLRKTCFNGNIQLEVVKNTLLQKAFEKADKDYEGLYNSLKGNTSIMFSEVGNAPAKIIKEFRKKSDKPLLKGAYIEESIYVGDENLDVLVSLKSKEELIGDIVALLQSPAKNVVSALKSSGGKLAGIVQTLSERSE
ncbi:MAG: 50S ribosomal protein L10 [Flavobacteriales bacterium]|nr:50S ribosomal protein L10 [Flavobacteriales bacterium]MCW8911921.1 50S ribosomal protein L10 [Flavobacteriales bacterium]MCW8937575.1 50S ribosomal protein L10 [Flavobacteriales bacterium]MCW8941214.1 50S ribosomal protein L10 [Flavobacteriales bacterium]MCW8968946.1 50S ribosomal protein L10 [Flavobacteriales bacterium]